MEADVLKRAKHSQIAHDFGLACPLSANSMLDGRSKLAEREG